MARRNKQSAMIEANSNADFGFKNLPLLESGIYQGKAMRYGTMKSGRHYIVCEVQGREVWRTYPATDGGTRWITNDLRNMLDAKGSNGKALVTIAKGKITPPATVWCDVGVFATEFATRNQVNGFLSEALTLEELGADIDDEVTEDEVHPFRTVTIRA